MKKPSNNTILIIIASLIVAGGIYWYFFTGSPTSDLPLTSDSGAQTAIQTKFEMLIVELGPISFDTTILSDTRFTALVDLTTPITEEPVGRKDPFAPVSGVTTK